ncbi:hypothetical protein FQZ97_887750 [compost metagenome]
MTVHAQVAREHVVDGVVAHMAHVQLAAGVGQHGAGVELLLAGLLGHAVGVVGVPVGVRGALDVFVLIGRLHETAGQLPGGRGCVSQRGPASVARKDGPGRVRRKAWILGLGTPGRMRRPRSVASGSIGLRGKVWTEPTAARAESHVGHHVSFTPGGCTAASGIGHGQTASTVPSPRKEADQNSLRKERLTVPLACTNQ